MSNYERRTRFILLACKHKLEMAEPIPDLGSEQYCVRCATYKIVSGHLVNYRAKCKARHRWARNFGDSKENAITNARRHANAYPSHAVEVFQDSSKIAEVTNVGVDYYSTHEEMRASAKESIQILKDAFPGTEVINEYETKEIPF